MNNNPQDMLMEFFSQYKNIRYRKGEVILRPDDDPQGVFYIQEGIVKKYAITSNGREAVVNIFKPGAFFPMHWALNKSKIAYFYETTEPSTIWRAPRQQTIEFIQNNPVVLFDLLKRIYIGLEGVQKRVVGIMAGEAKQRLATEIVITAQRFGNSSTGETTVIITEKDLADRTGLSRETISREMKALKTKGLIDLNKHVLIIPDLTALEEYSLS